ncbi:MAG: flippase-like domain-containing protein [Ardenticatenales bacterium]|nr:flippase-like domain-containing protein [Ardenticatenales bacterium]
MIRDLWQKLLLSLLLGVGVLAAFMLYTDVQSLRAALTRFDWRMLLPVLLVTGLNLLARFLKWEYYLRRLDVQGVSRSTSLAIFLANYALILTPGKVGALLKSYFLKQSSGIPVARTMPIIVAERLTDGLGMLLMTTVALFAYPAAWPVVLLTFLAVVALILVIQIRPLALRLLSLGERLPGMRRFAGTLHILYESAYDLLRVRALLWATFLGTVARAMEGVALYFVLLGLGVAPSIALLEQSVFIAALSNIVGVIVMMPGGLGGTEGSMAGLLDYFVGLAPGPATAATLLSRFASLWIPALLGLAAMGLKRHLFFAPESQAEELVAEVATP